MMPMTNSSAPILLSRLPPMMDSQSCPPSDLRTLSTMDGSVAGGIEAESIRGELHTGGAAGGGGEAATAPENAGIGGGAGMTGGGGIGVAAGTRRVFGEG